MGPRPIKLRYACVLLANSTCMDAKYAISSTRLSFSKVTIKYCDIFCADIEGKEERKLPSPVSDVEACDAREQTFEHDDAGSGLFLLL